MLLFQSVALLGITAGHAVVALRAPLTRDVLHVDGPDKHLNLTHDLFAFHKNLTQIESITGNEKKVGEWLEASLKSQGYSVERQVITEKPLRFNVHAWPGKKSDAGILLSSHIDTVSLLATLLKTSEDSQQL
jgi:acetylornithine deacetylase